MKKHNESMKRLKQRIKKRDKKRKKKMKVSGRSVVSLKRIIDKKSKE